MKKVDKVDELVGTNRTFACIPYLLWPVRVFLTNFFYRKEAVMTLDLLPGESRGYWKSYAPEKWFKQAKASGKINNICANLLFDFGAEVSILDIAFARKAGCQIDTSERQECVGIGEAVYTTEGRTNVKITLNGVFVSFLMCGSFPWSAKMQFWGWNLWYLLEFD